MIAERRQALLAPHREEHRASVAVTMHRAVPKGFGQLVSWFLREWASETPTDIHVNEVWRDWVRLDENRKAQGGSLLGAHKYTDDFRTYIEGSPMATDTDGRYQRPLRAALARLCGRGGHSGETARLAEAPFMARFLFRYGASGGQLAAAAESMGIPNQVARVYAEQALFRVYRAYEVGPNLLKEDAA